MGSKDAAIEIGGAARIVPIGRSSLCRAFLVPLNHFKNHNMRTATLNIGVTMPMLGLGVFQIPGLVERTRCVVDAIQVGYRLIDTAASPNEAASTAIRVSDHACTR